MVCCPVDSDVTFAVRKGVKRKSAMVSIVIRYGNIEPCLWCTSNARADLDNGQRFADVTSTGYDKSFTVLARVRLTAPHPDTYILM